MTEVTQEKVNMTKYLSNIQTYLTFSREIPNCSCLEFDETSRSE